MGLRSLQHVTTTLTGATTQQDVTITSVDTTKAFLRHLGTEGANSIDSIRARIQLLNATTVRVNRANTVGDTIVNLEVAEMN